MIGKVFAERYEIFDRLGDGATGVVWAARDTNLKVDVALKMFPPGASSIHAYAEASTLMALEGEHVLRVYNADTHSDIPYIASRIAPNGTSGGYLLSRASGVRPDIVVTWIRQALVGLSTCHERGLLHRDIKPENIFLDNGDRALLGDFGLVHRVDSSGRAPKDGSPFTMAPEMWAVGMGDVRADIYAMGVTAFRLLTNRWPIHASTRADLEPLVIAGRTNHLRDLAPHVSRRLAARVHKAMSLDPDDRYADWREMHHQLSQPGLVGSIWERTTPHRGHLACWTEHVARGTGLEVCTWRDGTDTWEIEARRATGSRNRLRGHCHQFVPGSRHARVLRQVFDAA